MTGCVFPNLILADYKRLPPVTGIKTKRHIAPVATLCQSASRRPGIQGLSRSRGSCHQCGSCLLPNFAVHVSSFSTSLAPLYLPLFTAVLSTLIQLHTQKFLERMFYVFYTSALCGLTTGAILLSSLNTSALQPCLRIAELSPLIIPLCMSVFPSLCLSICLSI